MYLQLQLPYRSQSRSGNWLYRLARTAGGLAAAANPSRQVIADIKRTAEELGRHLVCFCDQFVALFG